MTIGERINTKRIDKAFSLTHFAEKVGISKQTLYKYEKGIVTNIPLDKIEAIAKALDTTPGYLMGWEDDTATNNQTNTRGNYSAYDDVTNRHAEMFSKLSSSGKEKVIDYTTFVYNSEKATE